LPVQAPPRRVFWLCEFVWFQSSQIDIRFDLLLPFLFNLGSCSASFDIVWPSSQGTWLWRLVLRGGMVVVMSSLDRDYACRGWRSSIQSSSCCFADECVMRSTCQGTHASLPCGAFFYPYDSSAMLPLVMMMNYERDYAAHEASLSLWDWSRSHISQHKLFVQYGYWGEMLWAGQQVGLSSFIRMTFFDAGFMTIAFRHSYKTTKHVYFDEPADLVSNRIPLRYVLKIHALNLAWPPDGDFSIYTRRSPIRPGSISPAIKFQHRLTIFHILIVCWCIVWFRCFKEARTALWLFVIYHLYVSQSPPGSRRLENARYTCRIHNFSSNFIFCFPWSRTPWCHHWY
jgi:hypothetical protein